MRFRPLAGKLRAKTRVFDAQRKHRSFRPLAGKLRAKTHRLVYGVGGAYVSVPLRGN